MENGLLQGEIIHLEVTGLIKYPLVLYNCCIFGIERFVVTVVAHVTKAVVPALVQLRISLQAQVAALDGNRVNTLQKGPWKSPVAKHRINLETTP